MAMPMAVTILLAATTQLDRFFTEQCTALGDRSVLQQGLLSLPGVGLV